MPKKECHTNSKIFPRENSGSSYQNNKIETTVFGKTEVFIKTFTEIPVVFNILKGQRQQILTMIMDMFVDTYDCARISAFRSNFPQFCQKRRQLLFMRNVLDNCYSSLILKNNQKS